MIAGSLLVRMLGTSHSPIESAHLLTRTSGDQGVDVVERARPRSPEKRLQFGEHEFDRIEIGSRAEESGGGRNRLVVTALELFTATECRNYVRHCGYRFATAL